jgi:hypothetical protein
MNILGVRQDLGRTRRRRVVRDSRRRGLNPQDLRTMENILEGSFIDSSSQSSMSIHTPIELSFVSS